MILTCIISFFVQNQGADYQALYIITLEKNGLTFFLFLSSIGCSNNLGEV